MGGDGKGVVEIVKMFVDGSSVHWVMKIGIVGWTYDLLVRFIIFLRWLRTNTLARL